MSLGTVVWRTSLLCITVFMFVYRYTCICECKNVRNCGHAHTLVKYFIEWSLWIIPNHRVEIWISIKLRSVQYLQYSSTHYEGKSWLQRSDLSFQKVQGILMSKELVGIHVCVKIKSPAFKIIFSSRVIDLFFLFIIFISLDCISI